jgi:hypothetical protein
MTSGSGFFRTDLLRKTIEKCVLSLVNDIGQLRIVTTPAVCGGRDNDYMYRLVNLFFGLALNVYLCSCSFY